MKGIVFTEFCDLIEEKFGLEVLDQVIAKSKLDNDGVYTAVGTYPHKDLAMMVKVLSEATNIGVPDLLKIYGINMFKFFTDKYGDLFQGISNPIEFLSKVDGHIHVEVEKLYPDAELPKFETVRQDEKSIELVYSSHRKMSDFAEGLITGSAEYFGCSMNIVKTDLSNGDGTKVKFDISIDG